MLEDVTKWLESLGLGEYVAAFVDNAIDTDVLPDLTEADLEKIGVKLGHRKKLLRAIEALVGAETAEHSSKHPTSQPPKRNDGLAAWERHPDERKPATVLFADITGSTALTEHLDVEDTHDVLDGARQRMCAAVANNRGTVCRVMGDGVMAVFGAPVASEHHAAEACQAALEMQRAIHDYAGELEARRGSGLRIRVGLHSGEIVVLAGGEGDNVDYDADGPTVPIAARMEQSAKPGTVYLTAATRALAEQRIETEALTPVSIKGISDPVRVYALRRVRSLDETLPEDTRTPFVGRRAELNQFKGVLDTCIEEVHGHTVYVRGEPGIGKTRLVEQFAGIATEKGATTHRGLVLPFGVGKGQDAIRALVRSLLGIPPGSGKYQRQNAAARAFADNRLEPEHAVYLNDLLDLPQPPELRVIYDAMANDVRNEGKQRVVSTLITRASEQQPVLVIVEDVHWADTLTLTHLSRLARTVAENAALLVMTSRIEGDQLDQGWRSTTAGSPLVSIDLGPLRKQEAIKLIGGFIDTNDAFVESCLERAAGNPLFLEQLLRNAEEGEGERLPDSIQSLVLARMDRLDTGDKKALQAASVLGQRFDTDQLGSLLEVDDYDCRELVTHNLVSPIAGGFLFTHALIQESVYSSLIKSQRQELHSRAARWFAGSDPVLRAEHLEHAADARAAEAFLQAAREESARYRLDKAVALVERGLKLATAKDRFPLLCLHGELLRNLAMPNESIATYGKARESATSDTERCRASVGIAEGLRIIEAHDDLLAELDRAEAIAGRSELSLELARINQLRGGMHFLRGETDACIAAHQAAMQYAEDAGSLEIEAQTLSGLGDAEYLRGRMISAHDYFDRCIAISREQGLGKTLAANLIMRGGTARFLIRQNEAYRDFEEALKLSQETGQPRAEMIAFYAGEIFAEWGEWEKGEQWLQGRLEISRRLGSRAFEGQSLAELARIAYWRERRDEAERLAQEAVDTLRDGSMAFAGAQAFGMLALATHDAERCRQLLSEGEQLLRLHSVSHNYTSFYPDAMDSCLRMQAWDEVDRFAQALEDYTAAEPLPLMDFYIARGRALAAFGRGNRGQYTMGELGRLRDDAAQMRLVFAVPALEAALSFRN